MTSYIEIGKKIILTLDTQSPYSDDDQSALSLSAMLSWSNGWVINNLQYIPEETPEKKGSLKNSWGIDDRKSALKALNWLKYEGHRALWEETVSSFFNPEQEKTRFTDNLRFSEVALLGLGVMDSWNDIQQLNIDAWDYGRLVFVARSCYLDEYISEKEFWEYTRLAYSEVKSRYRNWAAYSTSYILGRFAWGGPQEDDSNLMMVHLIMLSEPQSIWNTSSLSKITSSTYAVEKARVLEKASYFFNEMTPRKILNKFQKRSILYLLISAAVFLAIGFGIGVFPWNVLTIVISVILLFYAAMRYSGIIGRYYYKKGENFKEKRDNKKARAYFLLAAKSGYHIGIVRAAAVDIREKRFDSSAKLYQSALEIPAVRIAAHHGLGLLAYLQKDLLTFKKHADYLHSHYSSQYPLNLYFEEGELLVSQGQHSEAITAYEKALAFGEENVTSIISKIATCAIKLNRYDFAIDQYIELYYMNQEPEYLESIITLLIETKQFEKAAEWMKEVKENEWTDLETILHEKLQSGRSGN